jgi:iron complex transport system substrate-binding protein
MRIVSLLPSATEIVCHLGLRDDLIGVTHECDYPPSVRDLPKVTRTLIPHDATSAEIDTLVRERLKTQRALYTLDLPMLETLRPDLIVTQALCDVCAVAEEEVRAAACALPGHPGVINLEPRTLSDVFDNVRQVASAANIGLRGDDVVRRLQERVEAVAVRTERIRDRPRVILLEWIDPPFCCGHWSPELIRLAGGIEGIGRDGLPSRTIRWEEILSWEPEVLLIACCGFDVERARQDVPILSGYPGWHELPCARTGRVYLIDGSAYFSRPGPRLVDSLEILAHALHSDVHPLPAGLSAALSIQERRMEPAPVKPVGVPT